MNVVSSSGGLEYFADGRMADGNILAMVQVHNATSWTHDVDFESVAGAKHVEQKAV